MTLPSAATKTFLDDGSTDTPAQALAEIEALVDKLNTIRSHLLGSAITSGASVLGVGDGLESAAGNLRAKLDGATLARSASGLKVADNAVNLAQLAHQSGPGVIVFLPDGSPAFLTVGLPGSALIVDSDSPTGLGFGSVGGGWQFIAEKAGGGTTIDFVGGTDYTTADFGAFWFKLNGVYPANASRAIRCQVKLATSGWTVDDAAGSPIRWGGSANGQDVGQSASGYMGLSGNRFVANSAVEAMWGHLRVSGIGDQADGMTFDLVAGYRDDSSNDQTGALIGGGMLPSLETEEIEGFRFYPGGSGNINGSIKMYGQAFPAN